MVEKVKTKLIALVISLVHNIKVKVKKDSFSNKLYLDIRVNGYIISYRMDSFLHISNAKYNTVYSSITSSLKELVWFVKAIKSSTVLFVEELSIPEFYKEDIELFKNLLREIKQTNNIGKIKVGLVEILFIVGDSYFIAKDKYIPDKEKFEFEQKKAKFELTRQVFEAVKKLYPTVKYFIVS